jgi:thiol-disulfide isomerase/thioredoxin
LDATESFDPDGNIVAYQWVFGDGYTGSGITKIHSYQRVNDYEVTLLVTDNEGATHMVSRTINPSDLGAAKPVEGKGIKPNRVASIPVGTGVGQTAPSFTLADLSGTEVSLADFLGQVVILNFWTSTCPTCQALMPILEHLRQRYQDRGLVVVGISIDSSASVAADYLRQNGYSTFISLWGPRTAVQEVRSLYVVTGLPRVFVVDRQGIVRFSGLFSGFDEEDIEPWL